MMAGSAFAANLDVNDPTPFVVENTSLGFENVTLRNDGLITGDGTGTITASGTYLLQSGTVHQVGLGGAAGVSKTTTGRVVLTGENTYTGDTSITRGVLQVGDGVTGSLSGDTVVTVGLLGRLEINLADQGNFSSRIVNNGGVRMTGSNVNIVSSNISGIGAFTQQGTGTTILTGSNSYIGFTTVENGTLQIGDGVSGSIRSLSLVFVQSNGTLAVNLADGGTLANVITNQGVVRAIASGTNTITGVMSGAGRFEQAGTGTTILTGLNLYTGDTYVQSGTLQIGNGLTGSISSSSDVYIDEGATLALNLGNNRTFRSDIENSGLVAAIASGTNYIDAVISGTGSFVQAGTGTTVFEDSNTYTGSTAVLSGTLKAGVSFAISDASAVYVDSNGVLDLRDTDQRIASLADGANGGGEVRIDNAYLEVGASDSSFTTFSGSITGSGGWLTKVGQSSQLTLTGTSTYDGVTEVYEGVLQIGDGVSGEINSASLVSINEDANLRIKLANDGVFANQIDNAGIVFAVADGVNTISGLISGTGDFVQYGTGTTIVTGANTYTGKTIVATGTLQIGDGVTVGSSIADSSDVLVYEDATLGIKLANGETFSNAIENDGTVRSLVALGVTNTIDGSISGYGSFIKEGEGTTIFNNTTAHSYTGETYVAYGVLQTGTSNVLSRFSNHYVGLGGTLDLAGTDQDVGMLTGVGVVDLGSGGTLDVGAYTHDSGIFAGEITGSGMVAKRGEGTWVLTGNSTFEGELFVADGNVGLFGSLASHVDNHGGFYGTGYVAGSVTNHSGGLITGGDISAPGTLRIGGGFYQEDGTYLVQLASRKNYSRIEVAGEAELDGYAILHPVAKYKPKRDDKLTILTADGGVSGKFSKLQNELPASMLKPKLVYKDDRVIVEFEQQKFSKLSGLTPNQKSVARGLDKASNKRSLDRLFDKLNDLSIDNVPDALSKLSPEQFAAIFNIGFATSQLQFGNIERRLEDARRGSSGFSTNGLALTNSHGSINYDGAPLVNEKDGLTLAGWDGRSVVGKQAVAPVISESRWNFFMTGVGEWADVENTRNALGSEFSTGGITIGADYRVNSNLVVGVAGGYTHTGSDLNDGGKVEVNSGRGALYGTWFNDGFYVNALAGGAYNSYDTRRSTFGGKARGDTNGGEFDALLGTGYDFKCGGLTFGPIGSLQYTYIGLSSFTEHGSDAPLHFKRQHQDSLKSTLGIKASYDFNVCGVTITPEVRAQWLHEYLDSTPAVESSFASGVGSFSVNGAKIGRDGLLLDAGVTAQFNPNLAVFAYYTGDLARSNYTANSVNGGFRISF